MCEINVVKVLSQGSQPIFQSERGQAIADFGELSRAAERACRTFGSRTLLRGSLHHRKRKRLHTRMINTTQLMTTALLRWIDLSRFNERVGLKLDER